MKEVDFVPKDGICCKKCEFWNICPVDYECKTEERTRKYFYCKELGEEVKFVDIRDGNSTEKVR